jgi:hypothetical protein
MMSRMGKPAVLVATIGGVLAMTACGSEPADSSADEPTAEPTAEPPAGVVPDDYAGRFRVTSITVLSSPDHGPQLCGAVAESYPPQCEGPDIIGWDWDAVEHESASGTKWGDYSVVGTFDDGVFTLTQPPAAPTPAEPSDVSDPSACSEPSGGWVVPDPSNADMADLDRAISAARYVEGHADVWISWLIPTDEITEQSSIDPDNYVLNVRTVGDTDTMEAAVRDVWGGNLCVATAEHTAHELNQIANEITSEYGGEPWLLSVGSGGADGKVGVTVWAAYERLWHRLTTGHDPDLINLYGMLEPID